MTNITAAQARTALNLLTGTGARGAEKRDLLETLTKIASETTEEA